MYYFLQISLSFVPGLAILFIVGAALRAAGDVITPLIINLIVNVINVFLLIALVNGQFGFEAMGVVGAAYAWGISLDSLLFVWLIECYSILNKDKA